MKIVMHPDPILREVSEPVAKPTAEIRELAFNLAQTMQKHNALGLSAPQVGVLQRVIVVKRPPKRSHVYKNSTFRMINPEIIKREDTTFNKEGCLSLPGYIVGVRRSMFISVRYMNLNGGTKVLNCSGLFAVAVQHEIDHLDGVLIIDHAKQAKKLKTDW